MDRKFNSQQSRFKGDEAGMSLIALSFLISIMGLFLASLFPVLYHWDLAKAHEQSDIDMDEVELAINNFIMENGRYPCPAPLAGVPIDDPAFGVEVSATDCGADTDFTGTFHNDPGAGRIRIGAIPTRTLNIDDNLAFDDWGNRYVYAVTGEYAEPDPPLNRPKGAIKLLDANDHNATHFESNIVHLVMSLGADVRGAYNRNGRLVADCEPGSLSYDNCDLSDDVFRNTMMYAGLDGNDQYTHKIRYSAGHTPCSTNATGFPGRVIFLMDTSESMYQPVDGSSPYDYAPHTGLAPSCPVAAEFDPHKDRYAFRYAHKDGKSVKTITYGGKSYQTEDEHVYAGYDEGPTVGACPRIFVAHWALRHVMPARMAMQQIFADANPSTTFSTRLSGFVVESPTVYSHQVASEVSSNPDKLHEISYDLMDDPNLLDPELGGANNNSFHRCPQQNVRTPLGAHLRAYADYLGDGTPQNPNKIILLSDGADTTSAGGQKPTDVGTYIATTYPNLMVDTISLYNGPGSGTLEAELAYIASVTGGTAYDIDTISNIDDFLSALYESSGSCEEVAPDVVPLATSRCDQPWVQPSKYEKPKEKKKYKYSRSCCGWVIKSNDPITDERCQKRCDDWNADQTLLKKCRGDASYCKANRSQCRTVMSNSQFTKYCLGYSTTSTSSSSGSSSSTPSTSTSGSSPTGSSSSGGGGSTTCVECGG